MMVLTKVMATEVSADAVEQKKYSTRCCALGGFPLTRFTIRDEASVRRVLAGPDNQSTSEPFVDSHRSKSIFLKIQ